MCVVESSGSDKFERTILAGGIFDPVTSVKNQKLY
jgi:hypothetical protein